MVSTFSGVAELRTSITCLASGQVQQQLLLLLLLIAIGTTTLLRRLVQQALACIEQVLLVACRSQVAGTTWRQRGRCLQQRVMAEVSLVELVLLGGRCEQVSAVTVRPSGGHVEVCFVEGGRADGRVVSLGVATHCKTEEQTQD